MAPFEDFFISGFKEAVGHLVAVAVRLGQVHKINLLLCIAVAIHWSKAGDNLQIKKEDTSKNQHSNLQVRHLAKNGLLVTVPNQYH